MAKAMMIMVSAMFIILLLTPVFVAIAAII